MFDVMLIGVHEEFKFSCSPKGKIYTLKDVFFKTMKKCWPLCDLFLCWKKKLVCIAKMFA